MVAFRLYVEFIDVSVHFGPNYMDMFHNGTVPFYIIDSRTVKKHSFGYRARKCFELVS